MSKRIRKAKPSRKRKRERKEGPPEPKGFGNWPFCKGVRVVSWDSVVTEEVYHEWESLEDE